MKRWLAAAAALLIVLSGCAGHPESSSGSESLPEESSSNSGPEAIPELPVEDSFGETAWIGSMWLWVRSGYWLPCCGVSA